ncbi:MAG: permease, partial [Candidatus Spyradocola sp.]
MEHEHFSLFGGLLEEPVEGALTQLGAPESLGHFAAHALSDFLEIVVLLFVVVTLVSFLQTYIPYERMRSRLSRLRGVPGFVLAIGLGMLSPFCSCSVIPLLIGFLVSGVPLTLCLAFLTSASCLNLTALTTLFSQMDLRFSVMYLVCCLLICVVSSLLVGARGAEGLVRLDKIRAEHSHHHDENTVGSRFTKALCSAWLTFRSVWPFLLLGVAASAAIAAFLPPEWISRALTGNALALPLATILGGCLHSDVFSILPIVQTIYAYSPAVSLAFLLSVMLFSIAEWALLSQVF